LTDATLPEPRAAEPGAKPKRKAMSQKLRFEVFKRDGFRCMYCGAHPPAVVLQVDHVTAVARGGKNDIDNLVTSCQPCNLGKGARDLQVAPESLAEKAASIAEREAQLAGYQAIAEARRERLDDETWRVLEALHGHVQTVPRDNFNSARRFIERLGVVEVIEAAEIALGSPASSRNLFRYFCGICWNKIREADK